VSPRRTGHLVSRPRTTRSLAGRPALPRARLVVVALAASLAVVALAGCGRHHPRPAALRLERVDLALFAGTLRQLQAPAHSEVEAAREVWPGIAGGLPYSLDPAARTQLGAAERRSASLQLPTLVTTEGALTGPTAKLAGMLKSYVRLTQRGWSYIATALAPPASASARFLRANAALYIYCVYDGHYDLSLIGKTLLSAYHELGGPHAFGDSLTQSEVKALAGAYSIPTVRLSRHPSPSVVV
jgi:hypothetical protein